MPIIVCSLVWTVLFYGAEVWILMKADEKRIESEVSNVANDWTEQRTDHRF